MAKGEDKVLSEVDAWKQLEDLFGSDSIVRPDEVIKTEFVRTGSPSLDRAIGVGGWPRGRLIQLAGAPSSGKTLMALLAIANWQREHLNKLAARQQRFVRDLEHALIRINNKTYGVCTITGKLISKERLALVPHATKTVEGKQKEKGDKPRKVIRRS